MKRNITNITYYEIIKYATITKLFLVTFCMLVYYSSYAWQAPEKDTSVADSIIKIPMEAPYWQNDSARITFEQHDTKNTLHLLPNAGLAIAKDINFSDGTITFDWKPIDTMFASFYFRYQSKMESECVYLRTMREGQMLAYDAIQYSPIIKGVNIWDLLGYYQGPADFKKRSWNQVKLVITGKQMQVFVNDMVKPILQIPYLEGNATLGTLAFEGEAYIANLIIKPNAVEGLTPQAGIDPTANDPRYLRKWWVNEPVSFPFGREPVGDDIPKEKKDWKDIEAERRGLINLTRPYGIEKERRLVWIKTGIRSATDQSKRLDFGFSDEVWVIMNGSHLYTDKNYYGQSIMKEPKGRCSIENTFFNLPLKKGDNELLIGVANNFYGWGIVARLQDLVDIEAINYIADIKN